MEPSEAATRRGVVDIVSVALVANLLGGGVVLVFLQWLTVGPGPSTTDTGVSVAVGAGYAVAASALVYSRAARGFLNAVGWLRAGREPTADERSATLALPGRLSALFFATWGGGAVLFGLLDAAAFDTSAGRTLQVTATTLLGGLTSCSVFYLVIERRLRPVFAVALAGLPPRRPTTIGIRPRLILSWALGSGVVLADLLLLPLARTQDRAGLIGSVAFLAVIGLAAGLVLTVMAARSVAEPIETVRAGLRRVQAGDLDVQVTVDDGGEVGLLQAGFNEMVTGLRERLLYRDLLDRHIGDEVARYAIAHGVGLGGELREVSVLFVDVIGSTTLAQQRTPSEVVSMLNDLFRLVMRAVVAEGGWINKFEGDAALCVFGAPDNQPDHAARALRAARQLRNDLAAWQADGGLDAAIGVSSGSAIAGNIGSEERYEYTVIGDAVNEAARLSELAKTQPARVLASGTIVAAAHQYHEWVTAGRQALRGRREATDLYIPAP